MQLGDTFKLGNHLLIYGDATKRDYYKDVPSIDLLLTDPPYNVNYSGGVKNKRRKIMNDHLKELYPTFVYNFLNHSKEKLKEGASYYIFTAGSEVGTYQDALKKLDYYQSSQLIWVKNHFVLSFADYKAKHEHIMYGWKKGKAHQFYGQNNASTVLPFKRPTKSTYHPTMKPSDLIQYLLKNSSKKGDVVFDPFGGSGTTLLEAERLGRTCVMMELDPNNIKTIIHRYQFHFE